jgi:hypothetical protein
VQHVIAGLLCGPGTNVGCGNLVVGNPLWLEIIVVVVLVIGIVAACIAFWRTCAAAERSTPGVTVPVTPNMEPADAV